MVFGPEGQEGCKLAANTIYGFDCNTRLISAKHLALNNCKSAYPNEDVAVAAAVTRYGEDGADDITSYDPNEVMAKAYHKKDEKEDKREQSKTRNRASGPLAFLGLQRT